MGFRYDDDDDDYDGDDYLMLPSSSSHSVEQTYCMTAHNGAVTFRYLQRASHPVESRCEMEPQTAQQLRYVCSSYPLIINYCSVAHSYARTII